MDESSPPDRGAAGLGAIFAPRSVAVVGASPKPGTLGRIVLDNLAAAGFAGPVYRVNPRHSTLDGAPVYPSVRELPAVPDCAVIVTPAATVPGIAADCGARGVRAAIVISAGFREAGDAGRALERALVEQARRAGLRFLGPNCLGVIRTGIGFNATFSAAQALPGRLAIVSQSGALCTAILDWARDRGVGFSSVISTGIGADVDFGEILDFLVRDPGTDSIMLYVEGIRDARSFMSALRAAARVKPVLVMKAGRHAAGGAAAASHTGALVGSDDVFDAALRRAGVLRVTDFADFFSTAATLSSGVRVRGKRVVIVTNAGGPGVMAADRAAECGLDLASLGDATLGALDAALPGAWSGRNPVDVLGDADAGRYVDAVRDCLADPAVDALLAILTPQALTAPEAVARQLVAAADASPKAVFACWMGGQAMLSSRQLFSERRIPHFTTPEAAVEAIAALAAYRSNQQQLLQVPEPLDPRSSPDLDGARLIIEAALAGGREWLDPAESKAVLAALGMPVLRSLPAHSATEAVLVAEELGLPVAMKILSPDITHKTDVGGVRLGLATAHAVRDAFTAMQADVAAARPDARLTGVVIEPMHTVRDGRELMVGVLHDEIFGPVVSFGLGGTLVEVLRDRAVALPPLNRFLVREMIGRTRAARALAPFRGAPAADAGAIERLLLGVSEAACELPELVEMDLNPVVASAAGACIVDARLRVRRARPAARPYQHMAIHPYPQHLAGEARLPDGTRVTIRPIRPEDAAIERDFVGGLSEQSKFLRFMYTLEALTPAMLSRFTQIDYDREMALIALLREPDGTERQVGVARYSTLPDGLACEFAIVVGDAWQGRGLARQLLGRLIEAARGRRLAEMRGVTLAENRRMVELARSMGFAIERDADDGELVAMRLDL